jgi:hypothetical protein
MWTGIRIVRAPAVFELVGGPHQADIPFLNQVKEMQPAVDVLLGDGNHQAQVGLHQIFLGAFRFDFPMPDHVHAMAQFRKGRSGRRLALLHFPLQFA